MGIIGLSCAAIVAWAVERPVHRLLASPPMVWLGRLSYGVYLWQPPMFRLLGATWTAVLVALLAALATKTLVENRVMSGWKIRRRSEVGSTDPNGV
jgi:peptidoglycan/LPS O-acetylase OafA/YrhL